MEDFTDEEDKAGDESLFPAINVDDRVNEDAAPEVPPTTPAFADEPTAAAFPAAAEDAEAA